MNHQQRLHTYGLFIGLVAVIGYLIVLVARISTDGKPLTEVAWQGPMLVAVIAGGTLFALTVLVERLRVRRRGERVEDVRDQEINRYAEFSSRGMLDLVVLATLIMLAVGAETFWTAHVLFAGSYFASVISTGATLAAYREGIPS